MPDPPHNDPELEEYKLFLHEKQHKRSEHGTRDNRQSPEGQLNHITAHRKDEHGQLRSFDINLDEQPRHMLGRLMMFNHVHQIDPNDLRKLEQYTKQADLEPDKTKVSVTRDLETDKITSFSIEDKWQRTMHFSPGTEPESYYILYLRVGSGHIQANLGKELEETVTRWHDQFEKEYFTIHFREPDRSDMLTIYQSLPDANLTTLEYYKDCRDRYHISQEDLAKIDAKMAELEKVVPIQRDRELPELTPDPPLPAAEFKIEKDERTGQVKQFTVYDEWRKEHVFSPETPPKEYVKLTWRDGYGDVNTHLPKELADTSMRWQKEYETAHIRLHEDPSGYQTYHWDVNIKDSPQEELERLREEADYYEIDVHDRVKIDHWLEERSQHKLSHDKNLPNAQIAIDRDEKTNVITQFTIYDREEPNNPDVLVPHLFNQHTTPDKWQRLLDHPETFNLKIDLTPEVQLAANNWKERSEAEHVFITSKDADNNQRFYWINLKQTGLEEIKYWQDWGTEYKISHEDQIKLEYYVELKELEKLELMNEKFQQEKILDITPRLQAYEDRDMNDDFSTPETKMLYEAQKLSVEEVNRQYGSDQLANVVYMFNRPTRDYFQSRGPAHEPAIEPDKQRAGEFDLSKSNFDKAHTSDGPIDPCLCEPEEYAVVVPVSVGLKLIEMERIEPETMIYLQERFAQLQDTRILEHVKDELQRDEPLQDLQAAASHARQDMIPVRESNQPNRDAIISEQKERLGGEYEISYLEPKEHHFMVVSYRCDPSQGCYSYWSSVQVGWDRGTDRISTDHVFRDMPEGAQILDRAGGPIAQQPDVELDR